MRLMINTLFLFVYLAKALPSGGLDRYVPRSVGSSTVDLGYSSYQGVSLQAGVNQYLGMRYAQAPLGDLRWRAPVDPEETNTTQDASRFQAICVGTAQALTNTTNEDCLFINVFAPSNATSASRLPVWLFIQGGGYATNSNANYNGTNVVVHSNHSLILVNFNYRVGAFGFLAGEKVQDDGDLNVGLLDQRKAMEWVQKYIQLFGGDPEHVVIHGASAGAGSVAYHLTAYGGRDDGLFSGAISESPFFPTHRTVAQMEFQFDHFTTDTSCNGTTDIMACLRSKDSAVLQAADKEYAFPGATGTPEFYWLPVVDGNFSTDLLYNLLNEGKVVKVPIISGDDDTEGNAFTANASTNADFLQFIKNNYPTLTPANMSAINQTYPLMAPLPEHAAWFPSAALAYGECTFTCAGNEIASAMYHNALPQSVWNYHYDVVILSGVASGNAVSHTSELPAVFGPDGVTNCAGCTYAAGQYNAPMVPIVMDYWISFILALDPNVYKAPSAPSWEPWGSTEQRLRFQLNDTAMEVVPSDQRTRCGLWKQLAAATEQ